MLWWFLILAGSAAIVALAGAGIYVRVRRHLKNPHGNENAH
jgi:hypothetical protein